MDQNLTYFDITWLSKTDGPGTRTVLSLQWCMLDCPWCHSPHSKSFQPQLLFFEDQCRHCGTCESVCPNGVHTVTETTHALDRSLCQACGVCVENCPTVTSITSMAGALSIPRAQKSPEELFALLRPQLNLLKYLGGLTICGGEPLLQYKALFPLLKMCKEKGINTALETSASLPWSSFEPLLDVVDHWLFGMRPVEEGTCAPERVQDWDLVTENFQKLAAIHPERIIVRTPLIPGYTNNPHTYSRISGVMKRQGIKHIELLPFLPFSDHYSKAIGKEYPIDVDYPHTREDLEQATQYFTEQGLTVTPVTH